MHAGTDWATAVRAAVAPRLLRPPSYEHSRAARRKDQRDKFNATWEANKGDGTAAPIDGGEEEEEDSDGDDAAWHEPSDDEEDGGAS